MAEGFSRKTYNEHFLLPDPLCAIAGSRSTIYRAKKRKMASLNQNVDSFDDDERAMVNETEVDNSGPLQHDQSDFEADDTQETVTHVHVRQESEILISENEEFEILCERSGLNLEELDAEGTSGDEEEVVELQETSVSDRHELALYEGAVLTNTASDVLIMQFVSKHGITTEGLADLLKLINLHCPKPNQCSTTPYLFKKRFMDLAYEFVYHHYCSSCFVPIELTQSVCPNTSCAEDLLREGKRSSFIEIAVEPQIQALFKSESVLSTIVYFGACNWMCTCVYSN